MGAIIAVLIFVVAAVFSGTWAGTLLWYFADTVEKFLPLSFVSIETRTWWECVRFGWVCAALFKGVAIKRD